MSDPKGFRRRRRPTRAAPLLIAVVWASPSLSAQPASLDRLTLSDAVAMAERQGFDSLLAEQAVRAAEADFDAARRLPNPLFSGSYIRSGGVAVGPSESGTARGYALSLGDQGVVESVLSGKRSLRVRVSEGALAAALGNRDDALRMLRFQVAQSYYAALAAEAAERVSRDVARSFARAFELVETRFRYGAVGEGEVARIETARLEAEQTVTAAVAQVAQAKANLLLLIGLAPPADVRLAGSLEGEAPAWLVSAGVEKLFADAEATRPDVLAARASLDTAEAALRLARRQRVPDVALSGGYAREGPDAAPITPPSVSLGASFEVPVFHRRGAEVSRAESARVSARISLDRAIARARTEVGIAWAGYRAASELVARMQSRLLGSARRSRELVEYQYRAGGVSLIDLLDAERSALAAELEYQQDLGQLRTAAAQLAAAAGHRVMP